MNTITKFILRSTTLILYILCVLQVFNSQTYAQSSAEQPSQAPVQANSRFQNKVYEYRPAPGQFIDIETYRECEDERGNISEDAVCEYLTEKMKFQASKYILSLGAYGGYIVVGFDHSVKNLDGMDLKIYGNAMYSQKFPSLKGGSAEPGIIMLSQDENGDGLPNDTWYEVAGSEYTKETYVKDYEITYYAPETDTSDIFWEDNMGESGYVYRNSYHISESYYPFWLNGSSEKLVFRGGKLPSNVQTMETETGDYYVLMAFDYGYADNLPNYEDGTQLDISWAVDSNGEKVELDHIDFVKVYTGVNQTVAGLGETSTEFAGVEDLNFIKNSNSFVQNKDKEIVVYPNPCTSVLNYKTGGKDYEIRLYDMQANLLKSVFGSEIGKIDVSILPKGVYFLEFLPKNGIEAKQIFKFLKI